MTEKPGKIITATFTISTFQSEAETARPGGVCTRQEIGGMTAESTCLRPLSFGPRPVTLMMADSESANVAVKWPTLQRIIKD